MSPTVPLVPVILCGGTGTRLWPLSRASYPKQYWALAGNGSCEATLLQQTQQRLAGLAGLAPPLLICQDDHRFNCCAEADGYAAEQRRKGATATLRRPIWGFCASSARRSPTASAWRSTWR